MLPQTISCTRATAKSAGIGCGVVSAPSRSISRFFPFLLKSSVLTITPTQQQGRHLSQQTSRLALSTSSSSNRSKASPLLSRPLATSSAASSNTTQTPTSSPIQQEQALSWNTYLSLRQKRRYYNLTSSILTGFGTFAGGVSFLMTQDLEKLSGILFGLDPVMALGLGGMAFGALGWLAGPFAGEAVFRVMYRRVIGQMEVKEKDFYHRIKKYRCDPSTQSVSNPVPDYYGEKISSVEGYRRWLKDQRAFRKKRETPSF